MKEYDAECPVCGAINHGVFLEETDGWMECERCGAVSQSRHLEVQCSTILLLAK